MRGLVRVGVGANEKKWDAGISTSHSKKTASQVECSSSQVKYTSSYEAKIISSLCELLA